MAVTLVKQYSVFLTNAPGVLKTFADLFVKEGVDILAISEDVRYDAAIMRFAVAYETDISHMLTQAGFTSVKTDAICLDVPNRTGLIRDIGAVMAQVNVNITSIYGTGSGNFSRWILVVNNISRAMQALEESELFG
jgi:hypothetical protein